MEPHSDGNIRAVEPVDLAISSSRKYLFWGAIALGAMLRAYCVIFTIGTGDLDDWQDHAQQVHDHGLIGYYHGNSFANHPPFMSEAGAFILWLANRSHVPFRILFRAPFALVDAANALLLFWLLPETRWRGLATACYWLSPAAILISAYHGNTDTAVPFLLLVSIWLAAKQRIAISGAVFGTTLWIKLPGMLALPALLPMFRGSRTRVLFLIAATITALATYIVPLIQDWQIVVTNVFGYRGLILQTAGGTPLWGPSVLLFSTFVPIQSWPDSFLRPALYLVGHSWELAIGAILILAWLRKDRHSAAQICATIGMFYAVLFGMSDNWAFQYFAWGLPFWFFLRWWFAVPAVTLTSLYLYALHSFFCGNPWLLGSWDFSAHPTLPFAVLLLRDLAVAFFLISGCVFLFRAIRGERASVTNRK
jgi:Gpi18-like mannosyltransferase